MPGFLLLLALGLAILWVAAVAYTAWMVSHAPRRTYASAVARGRPGDPGDLNRPFESWTFRSRGLDLPVWDLPGDDPGGPLIVMTHGWGDSRIGALVRVPALLPLASRIVLWDLPGHGEAPGVCHLGTAEVEDLQALLVVLGQRRDEETERRRDEEVLDGRKASRQEGIKASSEERRSVVLYGWSLGAGASIVVAADDPAIAAVIAESPYRLPETPARNVLRARGLPHRLTLRPALGLLSILQREPGLLRRGFDRAAHAARLRSPLLVLHGRLDIVSPIDDGRAIAQAASTGTLAEIAEAGHNNLWTEPPFASQSASAAAAFVGTTSPSSAGR